MPPDGDISLQRCAGRNLEPRRKAVGIAIALDPDDVGGNLSARDVDARPRL